MRKQWARNISKDKIISLHREIGGIEKEADEYVRKMNKEISSLKMEMKSKIQTFRKEKKLLIRSYNLAESTYYVRVNELRQDGII